MGLGLSAPTVPTSIPLPSFELNSLIQISCFDESDCGHLDSVLVGGVYFQIVSVCAVESEESHCLRVFAILILNNENEVEVI